MCRVAASVRLAHLSFMDSNSTHIEAFEPILTLSELAARLHVTTQTLYDLRSQGRGPHGFRVGPELRFRASEIESWLAGMEAADAARHPTSRREPA